MKDDSIFYFDLDGLHEGKPKFKYDYLLKVYSSYDDMSELLCMADVLISDYSSCMYDFSLQKKPCFVYAPDINEYEQNDRGVAYPVEKWPFSISVSSDDLCDRIREFKEDEYIKRIDDHFIDVGKMDDGNAGRRVVELINVLCK